MRRGGSGGKSIGLLRGRRSDCRPLVASAALRRALPITATATATCCRRRFLLLVFEPAHEIHASLVTKTYKHSAHYLVACEQKLILWWKLMYMVQLDYFLPTMK